MRESVITQRNFLYANFEALNSFLSNVNWSDLHTLGTNSAFDFFTNKVMGGINLHVPFRRPCNALYPKWYSLNLINSIREKAKILHKIRKYKRQEDITTFKYLRKLVKKQVSSCYQKYLNDIESNLKFNVKVFWSYQKN